MRFQPVAIRPINFPKSSIASVDHPVYVVPPGATLIIKYIQFSASTTLMLSTGTMSTSVAIYTGTGGAVSLYVTEGSTLWITEPASVLTFAMITGILISNTDLASTPIAKSTITDGQPVQLIRTSAGVWEARTPNWSGCTDYMKGTGATSGTPLGAISMTPELTVGFHYDSSSYPVAVAMRTSKGRSVALGAWTVLKSTGYQAPSSTYGKTIIFKRLSADKFLTVYKGSGGTTSLFCTVHSITGTTISLYSSGTVTVDYSNSNIWDVDVIDETTFVVVNASNNASDARIVKVWVCTIAVTTITVGTGVSIINDTVNVTYHPAVTFLGAGKFVVTWSDANTTTVCAETFTFSGTTITASGSINTIVTLSITGGPILTTLCKPDGTSYFLSVQFTAATAGTCTANFVATVSGTTVTAGTSLSLLRGTRGSNYVTCSGQLSSGEGVGMFVSAMTEGRGVIFLVDRGGIPDILYSNEVGTSNASQVNGYTYNGLPVLAYGITTTAASLPIQWVCVMPGRYGIALGSAAIDSPVAVEVTEKHF